ncbi:type VI secretion system-associated FHA domain protein TagH [Rhodanobacter sp. C05]|uniref:type VI secretion system-associated FHA domain protein TagH n=1 Tax=Rhodanobacter sp. C05 TaxID=1945855 RepID=UPI0009860BEF|nr:type VI secretion system-associated FHA domain protein TagH [Rhodanobacter sp. C05]OOG42713.1 peptide-binding protein [Rhodanobacter sp. C05]
MSQTLILAVAGHQAAQFGSRSRKTFEAKGGSVGRSEDCDWVLSASGISRVHAMIRYLNGMYFVEDRSTNGMLLNDVPLIKGEPSALKEGDRLLIDTFEVEIHLQDANAASAVPDLLGTAPAPASEPVRQPVPAMMDPLDFGLLDPAPHASYPPTSSVIPMDAELIPGAVSATSGNELDPLNLFGPTDTGSSGLLSSATTGNGSSGWNHSVSTEDYFRPPITTEQRQAQALPDDWDLTMGDFGSAPAPSPSPPAPAPIPPPPAAAPAYAPAVAVASIAETTGSAAQLPANIDQIFRVVVDGVMDVLRARAEIKNTFRLPVTIIQRSENNPLKFAPNPEEALQKIMGPTNSAFMSGTMAFEDAFDDIRCHQMAMLAGVRAAFESLLAHFNPDRFEQEADGGGKRSAFAGKGKYWEKYREGFDGLSKDPDECFRRLFGDEFARAYEEQLSRLKSARRMQKSARH